MGFGVRLAGVEVEAGGGHDRMQGINMRVQGNLVCMRPLCRGRGQALGALRRLECCRCSPVAALGGTLACLRCC